MIRITYDRDYYELEVVGHVEYDVKGKDIVCSAVSMVVNMLGNMFKDLKQEKKLKDAYVDIKPGTAVLRCTPVKSFRPNMTLMLDSVFRSFVVLEVSYPGCIENWIVEGE